jgi:hypothetical protein
MFPLFHLGIPLGIFEIPYIQRKFKVNRFSLLIGAIIPDIIDKLLYFIGVGSGRFIGHTLLFLIGSTLIVFLISQLFRYKTSSHSNRMIYTIPISYFIGVLIHLTLDLPNVPFLYPFIPITTIPEGDKLALWLTRYFTNPLYISTELAGASLILFVIYNNKLYHLKQMWDFLILTK